MTTFDPQPVTLEDDRVRLEPLGEQHAADLLDVGRDPRIWAVTVRGPFVDVEDVKAWMADANANPDHIPFAVIDKIQDKAVGSTRFLEIRRPHRALEIGWTWYGVASQRTHINTTCKLLLLRHAFEDLGAQRVQLKTDRRNEVSQRAIERIGGVREGVLRKHVILWDGYVRDSVYYSILDDEWPSVKQRLTTLLRGDRHPS